MLEIKKRKRPKSYCQRGLRNIEATKTKQWASKDISKECGKSKFYTINLVFKEHLIMQLSNYYIEYIPI